MFWEVVGAGDKYVIVRHFLLGADLFQHARLLD